MVIEKKRANILMGLMLFGAVSCLNVSWIVASEEAVNTTAPIKAIIQYVPSLILPNFILGKKMIDKVTKTKVMIEIIKVASIRTSHDYPLIYAKVG